jgi:ornithine cyclodeaminase/alanine dehydrogenase-like protein (mu-crystallin family)
MLMVKAAETVDALSISQAAEVIAGVYAGVAAGSVVPSSPSAMRIAGPPHRIQVKGAVLQDIGIAGARLSSLRDPRLILWDIQTGSPILLLEESWLYTFRTGISGAVVARWLSPVPRPRIALIGAGKIATHMARGFAELCDPSQIVVASRTMNSAEKLVEAVRGPKAEIAAACSIEEAVRGADIVASITTASTPLVDPSWIKEGALILSMGGAQEFSPQTWRAAAHCFVDDLDYALYQGDLAAFVRSGEFSADDIRLRVTSIGEVAAGRWPGRSDPSQSVYAVIQGLTALDLALAYRIYSAASRAMNLIAAPTDSAAPPGFSDR